MIIWYKNQLVFETRRFLTEKNIESIWKEKFKVLPITRKN